MTLSEPASVMVVLLAGGAAAVAFTRLRVPAAEVVGPVLVVGSLCATGITTVTVPLSIRFALQIVVGATIGQKMRRDTLCHLRSMVIPAALVSGWVFLGAFGVGWLLHLVSGLDRATAVLSACPGGLAEMSIMAVSFGAIAPVVVVFQVCRLMTASLLLPVFVPAVVRWLGADSHDAAAGETAVAGGLPDATSFRAGPRRASGSGLVTVATGLVGGLLAGQTGLPAAGVTGSMLGVGACRIYGLNLERPPRSLYLAARTGLGILVGTTLKRDILAGLGMVLLQAVCVTAVLIALGLILGLLIWRITGWPLAGCLLSGAPAGLVLMAIVADGLGVDPVRVSLLHLVRVTTIVLAVPILLAVFGP